MKKIIAIIIVGFLISVFLSCGRGSGNKSFLDELPEQNNTVIPQKEYTKKNPGNWKGLENEHLPVVIIYPNRKQNIVVTVPLKNPGQNHYIEKIAIVDKNKKELAVKVFSRHKTYFEAIFSLHPLPKDAKVYAKCNLHDLWITPLLLKK